MNLGCYEAREESDFCINRKTLRKLEPRGSGRTRAAQLLSCGFAGPILANPAYVGMRQGGLCGESYIYQVSDQMPLSMCNDFWGEGFKKSGHTTQNRKPALLALKEIYG